MAKRIVKSPPAINLINGIRSFGYTFPTAVADLIDNSITAKATRIDMLSDVNNPEPYFAILDNGVGMNEIELENAMIFGSDRSKKNYHDIDELGRFGLGLKSASISHAREFIVITKKNGNIISMSYDLDIIEETNDWTILSYDLEEIKETECVQMLDRYESGTLVIWKKFDKIISGIETSKDKRKAINKNITDAERYISLVYHRFYSKVEIYVSEIRIPRIEPFLSTSENIQKGRTKELSIGGKATPYTMPYNNNLTSLDKELLGVTKDYKNYQGFYVYRNDRLISYGKWLRMNVKEETSKYARVVIDFSSKMDKVWSVNVQKSEIVIPAVIRKELQRVVDESLTRSKNSSTHYVIKEIKNKNTIWQKEKLSDGSFRFKLINDDPLMTYIRKKLGVDTIYLDRLVRKIEEYIPKYDISHISLVEGKINNAPDNLTDNDLIEEIIDKIRVGERKNRYTIIDELLELPEYNGLIDRKKEIEKRVREIGE